MIILLAVTLILFLFTCYLLWTVLRGRWRERHWSVKLLFFWVWIGYPVDLVIGAFFSVLWADVQLNRLTLSEFCHRHYYDSKVARFIWDEYIIWADPNHLGGTPKGIDQHT